VHYKIKNGLFSRTSPGRPATVVTISPGESKSVASDTSVKVSVVV
jgi:hypothetical protein